MKTQSYPNIAGQTLTNVWDGRSGLGVPQLPGVYTVRLKLTDALGRVSYRSELVFIEKLSSGETELAAAAGSLPHAIGDWAVWQEQVSGVGSIRARNLAAGTPVVELTSSVLAQEKPRTDGRYVTWQARQANGTFDIMLADLTAAPIAPVKVTNTSLRNEINAAVHWPWVVCSAIKGGVRGDFYWGFGAEAGAQAGRMRQKGEMWVLYPRHQVPR